MTFSGGLSGSLTISGTVTSAGHASVWGSSITALTQAQATAVANQPSFLAGRVPHLVTSSTFSASTCP